MKNGFLKHFAGKKQNQTFVLTAEDARTISTNFSCLDKALARIQRKANLGIREITVLHLSPSDIKELCKLGYEVSENNESFKIKW